MKLKRDNPARKRERGFVILLVAIVLLFVVGAMAALSIDVVTFYTARSEAQLAADAAALAGARALANSGMTSDPSARTDGLMGNAETLANTIATEVAIRNEVGGRTLLPGTGEVTIAFNDTDPSFVTNPRITVTTRRADLPTFFARIWGRATVAVQASATAEAYNPSGINALGGAPPVPVAPSCVKPWILPNISPSPTHGQIIDPTTGDVEDPSLIGENISTTLLTPICAPNCGSPWWPISPTQAWLFYPGAQSSFAAPTSALPSCAASFNPYQQSVAGCVQTPIACGTTVNIDTNPHPQLRNQTAGAVNCLTSNTNNEGDSIDMTSLPPTGPYQFLTGNDNPLVQSGSIPALTDVIVSDSLVTVPIFDNGLPLTSSPTVIGFVQLFLNQNGSGATVPGISTQVINIVGCGTRATGQPILGNGGSPVPVRLITPP